MSSRTVVESPQFTREKAEVAQRVERLEEILRGVVWALERDPRRFPQVRGTRLHRIFTDPFPNAPAVRVWYTYDILHQEVYLLSIERVDAKKGTEADDAALAGGAPAALSGMTLGGS